MSSEDIEANLHRMLGAYPDAPVTGIRPTDGRFTPAPEGIELGRRPPFPAAPGQATAMHLVKPPSKAIVIEQFRQSTARGASVVSVELLDGTRARFALFDTTDRYGIVLLIVIRDDDVPVHPTRLGQSELVTAPARSGRVRRTDSGAFIDCDDGIAAMLGFPSDELKKRSAADMVHPDDYPSAFNVWLDLLTEPPGSVRRVRARYRRSDDSWLWVELTFTNHLDDPDEPHFLSEFVDISEEMAALDEVWRRGELLARLTETLPVGVAEITTERTVSYCNERLGEITGSAECETYADIFRGLADEDRPLLDANADRVLAGGADADLEIRLRPAKDRPTRYCQVSLRPLRNQAGQVTGALLCLIDVTDNTRLRQELEVKASYDDLTGCLNRATIMVEIERALALQRRGTALVFIDLDGFKEVNDTLGHSAGDAVLTALAEVLRETIRAGDRLGRLGGDEFVVLCPDVPNARRASEIAQRLGDAIHFDLDIDGTSVPVRASIGVSWTAGSEVDADALVASADRAMYQSKRGGGREPITAVH